MTASNCQLVATRVEPQILEWLDEVAKARGISRSDLLRLLIKEELARLSFLPDNVKKALGVPPDMRSANSKERRVEENG